MQDQTTKDLEILLRKESRVLAAYLFGSYAKGNQITGSDIDIAILLSDLPQKMLQYYLHLVDDLSRVLGNEIDLIILNTAPPLLKHQTIKHGKLVYCRDERARVQFEARAQDEYLDFSRAAKRYDECLVKQVST